MIIKIWLQAQIILLKIACAFLSIFDNKKGKKD